MLFVARLLLTAVKSPNNLVELSMENVVLQKRSTTLGAAPTTSQLQPGEIAVNVVDGKVFIKSAANTIEDLMSYTIADGGEITAA